MLLLISSSLTFNEKLKIKSMFRSVSTRIIFSDNVFKRIIDQVFFHKTLQMIF